MLSRLTGLPPEVRRALLLAAASGGERVQPVLDALQNEGLDRSALEPAEEAGVLVITGERFEFRHPLLRSAIYYDASRAARRSAHAALAEVGEAEPRAWHVAEATVGEDETAAAELERVGIDARHRGAPATAAAALERAARLSAPGETRVRRLTEAAEHAHIANRPAVALRLLDEALAGARAVAQRADIQHVRGRVLFLEGNLEAAYLLLVDEAHLVRGSNPDLTATMLAEAGLTCLFTADIGRAIQAGREACAEAATASPGVQTFAQSVLAAALLLAGERADASVRLDRLLPLVRLAEPLSEAGETVSLVAQCYFWLERYDVASELLAKLIGAARSASAPAALLVPLCCRAELDLRVGRWRVAAAGLHEAARLGEQTNRSAFTAYALECLARLAAATGDEPSCRDYAARALSLIDEHHNELGRLYVHSACGLLELGLGRMSAAISRLELARELAESHGLTEPNVVHWQADLVEARARAGQLAAADDVLRALEHQAARTGGRWALGTAARCRGLLGADPDMACFQAALEHLGATRDSFEIARTHLCHGERLRRGGRRTRAREELRLAIDEFRRLGASPWVTRAQAELRASGETARPRRDLSRVEELTPHELQVALIVADGASNREAAAALFLSPKTIEFHLAHIYRKLDVRSRTQLAGHAAKRGWLDGSVTAASPPATN
jgi:DNA-binding CsgD family transcriptional regulator